MHSPRSWSKIGNWSILFIFVKMDQENVLHNIFEAKTSFKDHKISKLKKSKKMGFFQRG